MLSSSWESSSWLWSLQQEREGELVCVSVHVCVRPVRVCGCALVSDKIVDVNSVYFEYTIDSVYTHEETHNGRVKSSNGCCHRDDSPSPGSQLPVFPFTGKVSLAVCPDPRHSVPVTPYSLVSNSLSTVSHFMSPPRTLSYQPL